MQLKSFNPENTPKEHYSVPSMFIYPRSGLIIFNKKASEDLGLSTKSQVQLHQDEENPDDWYIEIVKSGGFTLREKIVNRVNHLGLFFNSTNLARKITGIYDSRKSIKYIISGEPTIIGKQKLYGLLKKVKVVI